MSDIETRHWEPNRDRTLWIAGSLALVLLPHAHRMPFWVTLGFVLLAFWRIEHVVRGTPLPGRWMRVALSLAIVLGVYASYGTLFGRNAGIAALSILAGMKLLEMDTLRDAYAAVFLGLFLVITNFLYSQTIPTGIYMVLVVIVLTAALTAINSSSSGLRVKQRLLHSGTLLVQALPLMLVLFVLFPRIPGPLWGLPKDAHSATSGLSDSMSPGTISQLGLSSAVAFRVEFDGPPPPPSKLYWRGPVFTHTDGRNWSGTEMFLNRRLPEIHPRGEPVRYTLTLEPHQQHWIFALDVPGTLQRNMRVSDDYQLVSTTRVQERRRYRLGSYIDARITHITPEQRRAGLRLPPGAHPKARALATEWRQEAGSDESFMERALLHFRTEPFFYTLRPPLLLGDPVDEFLFQSRRGFCEHYASAFTILMRAGGVPARVVTGYQGGEVNPLGDYLIVRQRDAHAWVEVWMGPRGWVRIDPTAAVSPSRIELGMNAILPAPIGPAAFGLETNESIASLFRGFRHGWDSINNTWNQWVLGYGPARQKEFLAGVGLDATNWKTLGASLLACIIVIMLAVALWLIRRRPAADPLVRAYARFCKKVARLGIKRRPAEGPSAYAERVCGLHPGLSGSVRRITDLYVDIRYAEAGGDVRDLRKAVATFRP